jgi:hypothetical protein
MDSTPAGTKEIAMSFRSEYPEYSAIEEHIRRARAERSVAIAHMLADAIASAARGLGRLKDGLFRGVKLENDIHALQVDALFRRSLPHR